MFSGMYAVIYWVVGCLIQVVGAWCLRECSGIGGSRAVEQQRASLDLISNFAKLLNH